LKKNKEEWKKLSRKEITERFNYTTKKVERAFSNDQFKLQELQTRCICF